MALLTRIDIHHHYFPPSLVAKKTAYDWPTPEGTIKWSPETSIEAMDKLGIQKAILSMPLPIANAHSVNVDASKIVAEHPDRFGFFATLPLGHAPMDVVLEELRFALDELKADGIAMVSSYGQGPEAKYLGHDDYAPLRKELHNRKAIVFVHGDQTKSGNAPPGNVLPVPIVEVPNETYKAAADLVTSGKKKKYSGAKIILSHAGGSTPFLACRVAVLSNYVGNAKFGSSLSIDEILEDFKSFYYETALSSYDVNLTALQKFVGEDHILFGTDFPAVTVDMAHWFTNNVDDFFADNQSFHAAIMRETWQKLQT